MAFIGNNLFGDIKGRLGNLSFRVFKGKTQMRQRPVKFKISYSEKAVALRNRFKINALFSKSVSDLSDLKRIWKSFELESTSAFNTICKYNFHKVSTELPTTNNIITPDGFSLKSIDLKMEEKKLNVKFEIPEKRDYAKIGKPDLSINLLIVCKNPFVKEEKIFQVLSLVKKETFFDFEKVIETSIKFEKTDQITFEKYQNHIVYMAVVLKNNKDEIIDNSETFATIV